MAVQDWDWRYPVELQDVAWDCAAASLTWALNAYGHSLTEAQVVAGLGPTRISPALGLLDASGAGIVDYLSTIGVPAQSATGCTWQDIETAAGFQPLIMGGAGWYHWTGVRMGGSAFRSVPTETILLANPAPGYADVGQALSRWQFDALGPFSAVWFPA